MYRTDVAVVVVFMAGMWVVLGFVLREVLQLLDLLPAGSMKLIDGGGSPTRYIALGVPANPAAVKAIVAASAVAAGAFATAALAAVLVQLRRNRDTVYAEDIAHLDKNQ